MRQHLPFHRGDIAGMAALILLLIPLGCTKGEPTEEPSKESSTEDVTDELTAAEAPEPPEKMRRIEPTAEAAKKGAKLFTSCAGCHGGDANGRVGMAPRLNSETFLAAASDDYLFNTIKHGRPGTTMIAWGSTFSDEQIEHVIAHLRREFPTEPAKLDESPLEGDPERGEKLFKEVCAACHGANGAGYQETANGTGIGRKGFVSQATDGFIRHIARHGKTGTAMRPMTGAKTSVANLSDEEIDSIIAYLRESAW